MLDRTRTQLYRPMKATTVETEQAIVNTVAYVDAFDYPLTPGEIHRYLVKMPLGAAEVQRILNRGGLVPERLSCRDGLYMLPGREDVAGVRRKRQQTAERLWPDAVRYGLLIARMPFVRMVAVTGSLAVNNVGASEDIDYLVITADDNLWVSRAFVLLIVRLAAQRGVELCPNYFLSERALRFRQENLYTAHEVAQMVPIYGQPVYEALRRVNSWTRRFLPNAGGAPSLALPAVLRQQMGRWPARDALEAALATRLGRRLDSWEMARKVRKFRRVYQGWQESDFSVDRCKGHFNHHQQRTLEAYARRVAPRAEESTIGTGV